MKKIVFIIAVLLCAPMMYPVKFLPEDTARTPKHSYDTRYKKQLPAISYARMLGKQTTVALEFFQCPDCYRWFITKKDYQRHVLRTAVDALLTPYYQQYNKKRRRKITQPTIDDSQLEPYLSKLVE